MSSVCLPICLRIYLSVSLSVCLFVYLSVYLSACLSICLSICLFVCMSVCLSASRRILKTLTSERRNRFSKLVTRGANQTIIAVCFSSRGCDVTYCCLQCRHFAVDCRANCVHVISVKHFTFGYQSEISNADYIPSKLRNSTGRQPVNPQMWSGRSKPPTGQCKICKLL